MVSDQFTFVIISFYNFNLDFTEPLVFARVRGRSAICAKIWKIAPQFEIGVKGNIKLDKRVTH